MLSPATIEQVLATEEKSVVAPDELMVLPFRRRRRSAVRMTRLKWGREAALRFRRLQDEQLKLARMIADGEMNLASQRRHIRTVRHTYETSVASTTYANKGLPKSPKEIRQEEGGIGWGSY